MYSTCCQIVLNLLHNDFDIPVFHEKKAGKNTFNSDFYQVEDIR